MDKQVFAATRRAGREPESQRLAASVGTLCGQGAGRARLLLLLGWASWAPREVAAFSAASEAGRWLLRQAAHDLPTVKPDLFLSSVLSINSAPTRRYSPACPRTALGPRAQGLASRKVSRVGAVWLAAALCATSSIYNPSTCFTMGSSVFHTEPWCGRNFGSSHTGTYLVAAFAPFARPLQPGG